MSNTIDKDSCCYATYAKERKSNREGVFKSCYKYIENKTTSLIRVIVMLFMELFYKDKRFFVMIKYMYNHQN